MPKAEQSHQKRASGQRLRAPVSTRRGIPVQASEGLESPVGCAPWIAAFLVVRRATVELPTSPARSREEGVRSRPPPILYTSPCATARAGSHASRGCTGPLCSASLQRHPIHQPGSCPRGVCLHLISPVFLFVLGLSRHTALLPTPRFQFQHWGLPATPYPCLQEKNLRQIQPGR